MFTGLCNSRWTFIPVDGRPEPADWVIAAAAAFDFEGDKPQLGMHDNKINLAGGFGVIKFGVIPANIVKDDVILR